MILRIHQIRLEINEDESGLKAAAAKRLGINEKDILNIEIARKSVDARNKNRIFFVYSIDVELRDGIEFILKENRDVQKVDKTPYCIPSRGDKTLKDRPVIIGSGPAGLFAGLILAKAGFSPLILERGKPVEERVKDVEKFWNEGKLNSVSNVQFGEGGAGTFSDGKLTTRIKDRRCEVVLREFVSCGAPEAILYENKPHLGTDVLRRIIKKQRERIISLGGEVRFDSLVTKIEITKGKVRGVVVNDRAFVPAQVVIAATGHSARDTYRMLEAQGVNLVPKSFAIGVRIEHKQEFIDRVHYGKYAGHPELGAAEYHLSYTDKNMNRGVYTFCMCPGGYVVAAASEAGRVVTNGMSYRARDGENANSAVVVTVHPQDFYTGNPLSGIDFQRKWEGKAFELAGGDYTAPYQRVEDFLKNRQSFNFGKIKPTYKPGVAPVDLNECLPSFVSEMIKRGLSFFDRKIRGFADKDALLTGVETRTSSPIRILRKQDYQSENVEGLYPIGEGAGYAGGIVSAAVDGIKCGEEIIKTFSLPTA